MQLTKHAKYLTPFWAQKKEDYCLAKALTNFSLR